jgi:acyl dehydratase
MSAPAAEQLPSCEIALSQAMIDVYAELSGDYNPIHVDPAAAAASMFGGTVAHGCIPLEPIFQSVARWLGRDMPAGAALRLRYRAPSRPGDVIRSQGEARPVERGEGGRAVVIVFALINQRDEKVIEGECEISL